MTTTTPVKEHAEFSASGSYRWLNCPASHELCKKAPPQRESDYAAEGTEAHKVFEFLLKNHTKLDAALKSAKRQWPPEMVDHAKAAVQWVLERLEGTGGELLCETKVDASSFTCSGQFGTLDAAVVEEFGRLTVIDYKYGAGVAVDVEYDGKLNSQLAYYALAVSHMYAHNFVDVELVVIQPRAYHESGETVRSVIVPIDELLTWREVFRQGVMATSDPKATFSAGKWCRFCAAAVICPELKERALAQAQVDFSDRTGELATTEPAIIAIKHLPTVLEGCEKLEAWIARVREHALHRLERGDTIPGFKLVAKRGQRRWRDEAEAAAAANVQFGALAFSEPKLLSPAQLEKAAKRHRGVDAWIAERVTVESSGHTMVRSSDKRPAINSVQTDFTVVKTKALPP